MNSFLVWLTGVLLGALCGYLLHITLDYNLYLLIAGGVIVGSSLGITINMQRNKIPESSFIDYQNLENEGDTDVPSTDEEAGPTQKAS